MAVDWNALVKPTAYFTAAIFSVTIVVAIAGTIDRGSAAVARCAFQHDRIGLCIFGVVASSLGALGAMILFSLRSAAAFSNYNFRSAYEVFFCVIAVLGWVIVAIVFSVYHSKLSPAAATSTAVASGATALAWVNVVVFVVATGIAWFAPHYDAERERAYRNFVHNIRATQSRHNAVPEGNELVHTLSISSRFFAKVETSQSLPGGATSQPDLDAATEVHVAVKKD